MQYLDSELNEVSFEAFRAAVRSNRHEDAVRIYRDERFDKDNAVCRCICNPSDEDLTQWMVDCDINALWEEESDDFTLPPLTYQSHYRT